MQAASTTFSLLHNTQQWLFLSRGKTISPSDSMGIDGWYLNIVTEKNKLAPSQHAITCVFDMGKGLDKFWSEYVFLSEKTPSEKKIYREKKMPFPLMVEKYNSQKFQLRVTNPSDSSVDYTSDPFYRKEVKEKYKKDEEFRQWFDYAVQISAYYRITNGMFKEDEDLTTPIKAEVVGSDFDVETSELYETVNTQEPEQPEQPVETQEDAYQSVF